MGQQQQQIEPVKPGTNQFRVVLPANIHRVQQQQQQQARPGQAKPEKRCWKRCLAFHRLAVWRLLLFYFYLRRPLKKERRRARAQRVQCCAADHPRRRRRRRRRPRGRFPSGCGLCSPLSGVVVSPISARLADESAAIAEFPHQAARHHLVVFGLVLGGDNRVTIGSMPIRIYQRRLGLR